MSSFGATELLIVLVIVLLIFGPKRLPALGRQLGGGFREFRRSIGSGAERDDDGRGPPRAAAPPAGGQPDVARPGTTDPEAVSDHRPS